MTTINRKIRNQLNLNSSRREFSNSYCAGLRFERSGSSPDWGTECVLGQDTLLAIGLKI